MLLAIGTNLFLTKLLGKTAFFASIFFPKPLGYLVTIAYF
jgi:hypothetical protein